MFITLPAIAALELMFALSFIAVFHFDQKPATVRLSALRQRSKINRQMGSK
jgi:hypothetical protein